MLRVTLADSSLTFAVRVQPRASQSAIAGLHDGALKIRLAAPPVDGAANEEFIKLFAKLLDVARVDIEILSGATSKQKIIRIHHSNPTEVEQALLALLDE
ncbi:MAG: YggU family protein [Acidobacteria bacterium]|nr:YggU family protein [Acidobacteriota bacterium]